MPPLPADAPRSFAEARPRLLLRPYGEEQYGVDRLEATIAGAEDGLPESRRITPELSVAAVVDLPQMYAKVSPDTLQSWDCTFDDLVAAVIARTRGYDFEASKVGEATFFIEDDIYAGAVWVMPQMAASLPIKGAPVAWALGRGRTLVTGEDDPGGAGIAATTIQNILQSGERVESVTPHRLGGDGWEPVGWPPLAGFLVDMVQRLHKSQVYSRQTEPLRTLLNTGPEHVNINQYTLVTQSDGRPWALANWGEPVTAAIPVVDEVVLVRTDGATVGVPWAAIFEQAEDLLEPITGLPARFLTKGFPTDDMVMAALGRR